MQPCSQPCLPRPLQIFARYVELAVRRGESRRSSSGDVSLRVGVAAVLNPTLLAPRSTRQSSASYSSMKLSSSKESPGKLWELEVGFITVALCVAALEWSRDLCRLWGDALCRNLGLRLLVRLVGDSASVNLSSPPRASCTRLSRRTGVKCL